MDKLLNAISETLAKLGLDEDTVKVATEEILSQVAAEDNPAEEVTPSDDNPAPEQEQSDVPPVDDSASAGPQEEVPTEEPAPSDDVPPADVVDQVPPEEPQAAEVPPAVPPFDPTELLAKLDELSKANEGLLARVQSLEDALKQAGVVDGSVTSQVGDDTPSVPGEPSDNDIFNEQLKMLNRKPQF